MKKTLIGSSALVALATTVVVSTASAQIDTLSYSDGDLLLGFRQAGASSDYLLDLGPYSTFLSATSPFEVSSLSIQQSNPDGSPAGSSSLGNIAADLSSAFGSNWAANTSSPVYFAAVGWDGVGNFALTTKLSGTYTLSGGDIGTLGGNIQNAGFGNYTGNPSTNNSGVGDIQSAASGASYASFQPGNVSFGVFNPPNEGTVSQTLQLEELRPGVKGQVVGTLTIQPTGDGGKGDILYTPTPEPASAAMLFAGAAVLGLRRRRIA
jgi:hypothetical protein